MSAGKEIENWLFPKKHCIVSSFVLSGSEKMQKEKGERGVPCFCIRSWWDVSTFCTIGYFRWQGTESVWLFEREVYDPALTMTVIVAALGNTKSPSPKWTTSESELDLTFAEVLLLGEMETLYNVFSGCYMMNHISSWMRDGACFAFCLVVVNPE